MTKSAAGIGNVIPNAELVEMAMGYARSRVVCAAARLGIADALGDAERSVDDLADACQADPGALYRLLRALAAIGVTTETAPARFRLTPFGEPLRKDAPGSAWPAVIFWADLLADSWSLLTECVRAGKPASQVRDSNIPSRWSQVPEADAIFRAVMGTAPAEDYLPLAQAWDFSGAKVVADLGGGCGALLAAVLRIQPRVRGLLVERETSIPAAKARFEAEDLASRCEFIAADLTRAVPPGADVYILKQVLHGYRDEGAVVILKNCRAVLPRDGRLLIMEFILPALVSRADPRLEGRLLSDLNMLAVTGGKERSEREWKALLEAAGLRLHQVHSTSGDGSPAEHVAILETQPV